MSEPKQPRSGPSIQPRSALVERITRETKIKLSLDLDGEGKSTIQSGCGFFNHMLELFCCHGFFDVEIVAEGDTEVDYHHLLEDTGICLGQGLQQALGSREGIRRYGGMRIPMDETLAECVIDLSGRPFLVFTYPDDLLPATVDIEAFEGFFRGFAVHAGATLHVRIVYGRGWHHGMEALFKAFAVSLDHAVGLDTRRKGVPSSKALLDGSR